MGGMGNPFALDAHTKNDSIEKPPNAEADMKAPEFAKRELL